MPEAEPLMRRVVEISLKFTASTGHPHPNLEVALGIYHHFLTAMGDANEQAHKKITALLAGYGFSPG